MADVHDNRAVVILGGDELELVASKRAERIYGDRFRHDIEALGKSNSYYTSTVPVLDADGKPAIGDDGEPVTRKQRFEYTYSGQLKFDIAVSSQANIGIMAEIPHQVVAATWAMAVAAGSTDKNFSEFELWWDDLPSNVEEDRALFEAVCVDLLERAFFRNFGGQARSDKPNEAEEA